MKCKHCGEVHDTPKEVDGILLCPSCGMDYDWATSNQYRNEQNQKRLAEARGKSNKSVIRSHRLKK